MNRRSIGACLVAGVLLFSAATARAATVDPADLAFWQTVQDSKNAAEYQAYLNAFPAGVFADLAKLRVQQYQGGGGATPAQTVGQTPPPPPGGGLGPVVGKGIITPSPAAVDVGDKLALSFSNFPHFGQFDYLIVVPAGTPDSTGTSTTYQSYLNGLNLDALKIGPFAPGAYEVRWMTNLYNNQNKYEIGARSRFTVNP